MNFKGRLKSYLIGVLLGMIMVFFLCKDKTDLFTSWLPQNRVLLQLTESQWQISEKAQCALSCVGTDTVQLRKDLVDSEVDFGNSDVKNEKKVYTIVPKNNPNKRIVQMAIQDSLVTLVQLLGNDIPACNCAN